MGGVRDEGEEGGKDIAASVQSPSFIVMLHEYAENWATSESGWCFVWFLVRVCIYSL